MTGILEQGQQIPPAEQPGAQPQAIPGGQTTAAPDVPVDPQLQEQMDVLTANGLRMIHKPSVSDGLIKRITTADDPVMAIADSTLDIVNRLEASAKQNNMEPDFGVLAQSANVLMGEIIEIAQIGGLPPLNDEEKYKAFSLAVSKYIDEAVKSGKLTSEQLQEMSQEAQQTPEGQSIMQASEQMAGGPPQGAKAPGMPQPPQASGQMPGQMGGM